MVEHCFCSPEVPSSNLTQTIKFFIFLFYQFLAFVGSSPGQNCHFPAVFSGYGTYTTKFSIKFGLKCTRWQVEESGGNWSNFEKEQLLVGRKREILIFKKFPRSKSKIF